MTRVLTALIVLFYVLIPQTGFCLCEGCNCENKLPSRQEMAKQCEKAESSCCCCKSKVQPPSCCGGKTNSNKDKNQTEKTGSCSCSCSDVKENPPTTQSTVNLTFSVAEHFKEQLESFVTIIPQPEISVGAFLSLETFDTPISRLSVRLHLLFLVFLN